MPARFFGAPKACRAHQAYPAAVPLYAKRVIGGASAGRKRIPHVVAERIWVVKGRATRGTEIVHRRFGIQQMVLVDVPQELDFAAERPLFATARLPTLAFRHLGGLNAILGASPTSECWTAFKGLGPQLVRVTASI